MDYIILQPAKKCLLRKSNPEDVSKEILGFKSVGVGTATYLMDQQ